MTGFLLIILSTAFSLGEGILIRCYNSRHEGGGFLFTALVSLGSMLFFLIYDLVTDRTGLCFPPEMLPYALIAGLLYCSASLLTYVALECGPFAISMLILSYSVVFSTGYGILILKEPVTPFFIIGLVLIAVSLFLVRGKNDGSGKKMSLRWLVCILVSTFGCGMFGVVQRMQQLRFDDACTNEFMILSLALSAVTLAVTGIVRDRKRSLTILKQGSPYACCAGLANGATNMLSLVVNTMIAISVASPTRAGVKSVLSFLVSLLLFKEHFLPRQVAGVILGAIAVVFLNWKI